MQSIDFPNGENLTISDVGKDATYTKGGKSISVKFQGMDSEGGVTFQRNDGACYYQKGTRPVRLNPLTAPTYSPKELQARPSGSGNPPFAQPAVGFRNGNMNRGQSRFTGNQYRLGLGAGKMHKLGKTPTPPQNNIKQFCVQGVSTLPANPGVSSKITLINTRVPSGYKLRLSQYFLSLGPTASTLFWEDNLIWRIKLGGFDILNPFNITLPVAANLYAAQGLAASTTLTGRPVRANILVPFTLIENDLETLDPGTEIIVTCEANQSWPAGTPTGVINATLIGTLWGAK